MLLKKKKINKYYNLLCEHYHRSWSLWPLRLYFYCQWCRSQSHFRWTRPVTLCHWAQPKDTAAGTICLKEMSHSAIRLFLAGSIPFLKPSYSSHSIHLLRLFVVSYLKMLLNAARRIICDTTKCIQIHVNNNKWDDIIRFFANIEIIMKEHYYFSKFT